MKIKSIVLILFLFAISLEAQANRYYLLGATSQNITKISQINSIVWNYDAKKWSVSSPLKSVDISTLNYKKDGYILINNNSKNDYQPLKRGNTYIIHKGWNYFNTPKDGIDIVKSFHKIENIQFIYSYDKVSKVWAGYSPHKELQMKMASTRILNLRYIEPHRGFYIYASQTLRVKIEATVINKQCQSILDKGYSLLIATGIDKKAVYNSEKTLSIKSRYASHYRRGIYNDSRVALIFDTAKASLKSSNKLNKYGPVNPSVIIEYDKSLENSWFFIFDYFQKECYRGIFPSKKIPPFSTLQKIE